MPEFIAKVGSSDGSVMERTFTADSEQALLNDLKSRDYHVFGIRRKSGLAALLPDFTRKRTVSMKEFLLFNQELAALIPHARALDIPERDHMLAVGDRVFKDGVLKFLRERP